jgi:hypothetical protein
MLAPSTRAPKAEKLFPRSSFTHECVASDQILSSGKSRRSASYSAVLGDFVAAIREKPSSDPLYSYLLNDPARDEPMRLGVHRLS